MVADIHTIFRAKLSLPRVTTVSSTQIIPICAHANSAPIPMKLAPGYTEKLFTNQDNCTLLRVPALFLFGPTRQARSSGSYCLTIVAGFPQTTE
jgi:hypothetical protein